MECIDCLGPNEIVLLASIISIAISQDLDTNDINNLGNLFTAIGSNLVLIASQRDINKEKCNPPCQSAKEI